MEIIAASFGVLLLKVIAVVAVQTYQTAQLRAKFTAVVKATEDFKTATELCANFGRCAASGSSKTRRVEAIC